MENLWRGSPKSLDGMRGRSCTLQSKSFLGTLIEVYVVFEFEQTLDYFSGGEAFKVGQFMNNSISRLKKKFKLGMFLFSFF